MPENKDLKYIEEKIQRILGFSGLPRWIPERLAEIEVTAERMATEIKREGKVSVELFDHVKELEAQLKTVEGREANLQEELGNAVAKIHELEVSRDEWKKQWELEVSGRRLAEKEVAKLKDGYKVALELVETAKKEKEEIQENLRRRNAETTRLKHELQSKIEVVRCDECKNQNSNCECPFFDTIQYIKVDFCSAGVCKEGDPKCKTS